MNNELMKIFAEIEREKGIPRDKLIANLEEALVAAYRKKFAVKDQINVRINPENGQIKVTKKTIEGEMEKEEEVSLSEFGRIATQVAKQVIIQRIRQQERESLYEELKSREGSVVSGEIRHKDYRQNYLVDIGKIEAMLPTREQIKGENYQPGNRLKVYVLEVKKTGRDPLVIVSRTHPELLRKLFAMEIPEVQEGIVQIRGIVREPGVRAKIAISSSMEKVDPLGACVGTQGVRIQAITRELNEEKIDLVKWSDNSLTFISNALSPAKLNKIILHQKEKRVTILLEDEQLKLAIGKQGQNVRLASRLTGWQIDLRKEKELLANLTSLPGIGEARARMLIEKGITSREQIIRASLQELCAVPGIGKKKAEILKQAAKGVSNG